MYFSFKVNDKLFQYILIQEIFPDLMKLTTASDAVYNEIGRKEVYVL
ncbi:hypothetical protein DHBDCA_p1918 [Dehalobacter sp. DCA]|nr:hypothetical protein DHBDCA_p1918 [Dehalobacter sp. DCA]AFV05931.1 hypothetical protein DCF50_p1929 [Dehalobacter sp. CF]